MRIGELSRQTGVRDVANPVSTSAMRCYPNPAEAENGYRDYPDSTLKMLKFIDAAQRLGFLAE